MPGQRRHRYGIRPGVEGLGFIPDYDRVGTSTSPEGVLTNKIFDHVRQKLIVERALQTGRAPEDVDPSEVHASTEYRGRQIYHDVLQSHCIEEIVMPLGRYFREKRREAQKLVKLNLARNLAEYYIKRDWERIGTDATCKRHRIPTGYSKEESVALLSTMLYAMPIDRLRQIEKRVGDEKSGRKKPPLPKGSGAQASLAF